MFLLGGVELFALALIGLLELWHKVSHIDELFLREFNLIGGVGHHLPLTLLHVDHGLVNLRVDFVGKHLVLLCHLLSCLANLKIQKKRFRRRKEEKKMN